MRALRCPPHAVPLNWNSHSANPLDISEGINAIGASFELPFPTMTASMPPDPRRLSVRVQSSGKILNALSSALFAEGWSGGEGES